MGTEHATIRRYHHQRGAARHQFDVLTVEVIRREVRSEPVLVPRADTETGGTSYSVMDGQREYALIREDNKRPRWVYASELTDVQCKHGCDCSRCR